MRKVEKTKEELIEILNEDLKKEGYEEYCHPSIIKPSESESKWCNWSAFFTVVHDGEPMPSSRPDRNARVKEIVREKQRRFDLK
jgi:hypothetical protein